MSAVPSHGTVARKVVSELTLPKSIKGISMMSIILYCNCRPGMRSCGPAMFRGQRQDTRACKKESSTDNIRRQEEQQHFTRIAVY